MKQLAALALFGRNLTHHFGALLGALAPYISQLVTGQPGWRETVPLSTGVIVAWLLANAHIKGKAANGAADAATRAMRDLTGGHAGAALNDFRPLLDQLLGGLLGGEARAQPATPMPPPPGMAGLFPSGGPVSLPAPGTTETVTAAPAESGPKSHGPASRRKAGKK